MESNFDLDINNYTTDDLMSFFKLDQTFSINDLLNRAQELTSEILSIENKDYTTKYKKDIIEFIDAGKQVLQLFNEGMKTNIAIKENLDKFVKKRKDDRTGMIVNPLSTHPALESVSIPDNNINGYDYTTNTSVYVFNTAGRNDFFNSEPSLATFDLPLKWKNVISISLVSANIPNVMYAFSDEAVTNQLYIEEDGTGISGIVTLPEGNYSPYNVSPLGILAEASFPEILTKEINEQLLGIYNPLNYRFNVVISLSTRKTTISNNTNTFRINTIRRKPREDCKHSKFSSNIYNEYNEDPPPDKTKIPLIVYAQTMGYLMGFRETYYTGKNSYTTESIFSNTYSNYLFFELDDYTGSQPASSTYGVLGENVLNTNILGLIPINSSLFATTFDNNANFIYKKREYYGPVDISRFTVKLLNQKGNIVNLQNTEFNFSIQVKTLYDIQNKGFGLRSAGFL